MRRSAFWVLALWLALPARGAMVVWTQSIACEVQPTAAAGASQRIVLEGARGSWEAAQVVVQASCGALSGVDLAASSLADGSGHTIASSSVAFFGEAFIAFTGVTEMGGVEPVPASSPAGDGRIPDPLIPFRPGPSLVAQGARRPLQSTL